MTTPNTLERSIWINAPRERVWRAITTDTEIMRWWGGDTWIIEELAVGGRIRFGKPDDLMNAAIAVLDPLNEFAIEWPAQPQYHMTPIYTVFRLVEENGGTRLYVQETGFEHLPAEIRQQNYDSTASGYDTVLANLKALLEGGE